MKRDEVVFFEDIIENVNLIEESIKGTSQNNFNINRLLIDATIRRLEIIGEAVKNISKNTREKHPEIEWKKIAGFRDVVIHEYFGVKIDKVWNVIKGDMPKLKKQIQIIKKDLIQA